MVDSPLDEVEIRVGKIIATFLAVGPLVGWIAAFTLITSPVALRSGKIAFDSGFFSFGLMFAHFLGITPALIVGVFVARQTRKGRRVSSLLIALLAAAMAFVFGYALDFITTPTNARRMLMTMSTFKLILILYVVPASFAAVVCNRLTQRWQGRGDG